MQSATPAALSSIAENVSPEPDVVSRVLFPSLVAKGAADDGSCIQDDQSSTIDYSVSDHMTIDCASVDGDIRTYDGEEEMTYGDPGAIQEGFRYDEEGSAQERTFNCETKDDPETDDEEETDDDEDIRTDEGSRDDEKDSFYDLSEASVAHSRDGPVTMAKAAEDANVYLSFQETFITAPTEALRHLFYFRGTPPASPQTQGPEDTISQNKQVESFQRDCKMMKEMIARDSKYISRLTAEIESLRSGSGKHELEKEIKDLRQREKSVLKEMEALQMSLNNEKFMETEASELQSKEIKRLQLQCQMFSFQIVELEKENRELTNENATLRSSSSIERSEIATYGIAAETTPADGTLRARVTSLVHRFSQIEEYMESREKAQSEQSKTLQALESIEHAVMPFVYSNSEISSPGLQSDSAVVDEGTCLLLQACNHDEDVEVTLDGLIIATSRIEEAPLPAKGTVQSTANSSVKSLCCFDSSCE
jgi:hypothetical protein